MSITEDRRLEQADAITFALRGEWQAAIDANIVLLKAHPNDIETLNRLAKACFEINQPVAVYPSHYRPDAELAIDSESEPQHRNNVLVAREIYEYVLSISSSNVVARKMLVLIERTNAQQHGVSPNWRQIIDDSIAMIKTRPDNKITYLNNLARACYEINTYITVERNDYNPDPEREGSNDKRISRWSVDVAHEICNHVLELDKSDSIALRLLVDIRQRTKRRTFMDMRNFVIETGTSTITSIHVDVAGTLDLVPGEIVKLRVVGNSDPESEIPTDATAIDVYDSNDLLIGRLDPSLALRIIRFMRQRNIYEAAVWRFSDHQQHIEIIVREVYAHPDNRNEVSFPGKLVEENERRMIVDDVEDDDAADDAEEEEITEETDSDTYAGDDDEEHERLESLDQSANDDSENED